MNNNDRIKNRQKNNFPPNVLALIKEQVDIKVNIHKIREINLK